MARQERGETSIDRIIKNEEKWLDGAKLVTLSAPLAFTLKTLSETLSMFKIANDRPL